MRTDRINIKDINPNAYKPLFALYNDLKQSSLTDIEFLLIQIRASQINSCAYCVQMHIKEAIDKGEKQYRIHGLPFWRDSDFYTLEEETLLEMTEEVTLIAQGGLKESLYQKAITLFGKKKVADIIMAICCINVWNRIGVATLLKPTPSQE
ncbi:carboxymuconolactone decarboxylase family protein [Aquimarina sp. 2201CG5-10]|uniref:carboxymuconolactone decarboxylase family protein n=1 Tax=Aquimarina callyspongiae TaxID=3098150 RepID=UPI002AB4B1DE|nr:carboxymuconolactone decarboxylase family protein [Aquimarina sp. 2201CG5-10]MDY8134477.1 carboxymuconolactone decarboxylase family protein [Aquimarina sp. 2201CG5-10]